MTDLFENHPEYIALCSNDARRRLRPANEDPQLARTFLPGHVAITGSGKHEAHDPHGEGRRNQREDITN
jgi:hypothetical protein